MDTIRPRPVDRGSRGVVVDGNLYVIHGNNTSLFWRLPLNGGLDEELENPWAPWERLEDVPLDNSGTATMSCSGHAARESQFEAARLMIVAMVRPTG